jgi:hypothetical protein
MLTGDNMKDKYTREDIGCYFDGAFGFEYNTRRIIEFAYQHGWDATELNADEMTDLDVLVCFVDEAIEYLNVATERPDNIHWSWEEGDFGLWEYDEEGELI